MAWCDVLFFMKGLPTLFPTVVHTVKTLSIFVYASNVDMVIDLMSCFPCLEKLYIQQIQSMGKNLWRRKHKSHIRCLDIRLKTIVLENYQGVMSDVNFATFFVLNAKMLELFRFETRGLCGKGFIQRQHRLLQLGKRASRGARFVFKNNTCLRNLEDIKHVRDLSVAHPFECWCWTLEELCLLITLCSMQILLGLLFLVLWSSWCPGTLWF